MLTRKQSMLKALQEALERNSRAFKKLAKVMTNPRYTMKTREKADKQAVRHMKAIRKISKAIEKLKKG